MIIEAKNNLTGEIDLVESVDVPPLELPQEPTIEERLAAVEAATLDLILGGAV